MNASCSNRRGTANHATAVSLAPVINTRPGTTTSSASTSWAKKKSTVATGSVSCGNWTFRIKPAFPITDPVDATREPEKKVQGMRPAKRKKV